MCTTVLASAQTCVLNEWEIRDWFFFFQLGSKDDTSENEKEGDCESNGLAEVI